MLPGSAGGPPGHFLPSPPQQQQQPPRPPPPACFFFTEKGFCKNGDSCQFSHAPGAAPSQPKGKAKGGPKGPKAPAGEDGPQKVPPAKSKDKGKDAPAFPGGDNHGPTGKGQAAKSRPSSTGRITHQPDGAPAPGPPPQPTGPCIFFLQGKCRYGSSCHNSHDAAPIPAPLTTQLNAYVYWDFASCPTQIGQKVFHAGQVGAGILNYFKLPRQRILTFYNSSKYSNDAVWEHLHAAGVKIENCPSQKANAVDMKMMDSVRDLVEEHATRGQLHGLSVVVITGDSDFADLLDRIVGKGVQVHLIHRANASSWALVGNHRLTSKRTWEDFLEVDLRLKPIGAKPNPPQAGGKGAASASAGACAAGKQKLCIAFAKKACMKGDACGDAHGILELATPRKPPSEHYKTKVCRFFKTGRCANGWACSDAHGPADLLKPVQQQQQLQQQKQKQQPPQPGTPAGKTQLCDLYAAHKCTQGDQCVFAHGIQDLQKPPPAPNALWKTQLCLNFKRVKCADWDCRFAHGERDRRAAPSGARPVPAGAPTGAPAGVPAPAPTIRCAEAGVPTSAESGWLCKFRKQELHDLALRSLVSIKEPSRMWAKARQAEKGEFPEYTKFPNDLYILPVPGRPNGFGTEDLKQVRLGIRRLLHGTALARQQAVFPTAHCAAAADRLAHLRRLLDKELWQLLKQHLEAVMPDVFFSLHVTAPCRNAKCPNRDACPFFHGQAGPGEVPVVCVAISKDVELLSQTLENIFLLDVPQFQLQSRAFQCKSEAEGEALKTQLVGPQLRRVEDEAGVALVRDADGTQWQIHGWVGQRLDDAEGRLNDLLTGCGKSAKLPLEGLALLGPRNSGAQLFFLGRGPLAAELQAFLQKHSWKWKPNASKVPVVRGIRPQDAEKFQAETSLKLLGLDKRLLVLQVLLQRPVHHVIAKHADVEKALQEVVKSSGQHIFWDLTESATVSAGSAKGLQSVYEEAGCSLEVRLLDIAKFDAAGMVISSNSLLKPQAGSAMSLEKAGGQVLRDAMEQECVKRGGKVQDAEVVRLPVTGDLSCSAVYCVVCPVFPSTGTDEERKTQAGVLNEAYYRVLTQAAADGYDTLALPLMGAGSFNWPKNVAAEQFLAAWNRAAKGGNCPQAVVLCEVSEKCAEAVIGAAGELVKAGLAQCTQEPPAELNTLALRVEPQKVSWQYQFEDTWKDYSADDGRVVEDEYLRDPQATFTLVVHTSDTKWRDSQGFQVYSFDLGNMVQTNQRSGFKRAMRRTVLVEPEPVQPAGEEEEEEVEQEVLDEKADEGDQVSQSLRLITFVPGTEPIDRTTVMASLEAISNQMLEVAKKELTWEPLELQEEELETLMAQVQDIAKTNFVEVQEDDNGQAGLYGLMENIRAAQSAILREALLEIRRRKASGQDVEVLPPWMPKRGPFAVAAPELLAVDRSDPEVIKVISLFEQTSRGKKVVGIQRVCNVLLWDKFISRRGLLQKKLGCCLQDGVHERYLFHGTGRTDPQIIWSDEDGLDMKYSNPGMWGNGIYFAEEAWYSCMSTYAYTMPGTNHGQLFVCKVLIGEYKQLEPTGNLKKPPLKESSAAKHAYDSVRGRHPAGVDVFIIYDNGLAYPEFLVEFE